MEMRSDERFTVLRSIGEECIYEDGLCQLLKKRDPICYVWFEPSPMMDIEQGILKTIYVNKMVKAGCAVKILMADWFLQWHPKIGSNLNKIRTIGSYNIAMWKAAGMYIDKIDIKWLSDELNHHALDYWPLAMDVSRRYTMKRMASYSSYMPPYGPQRLPAAEIIHPCMPVAALLCQKADVWLFSMDQREIIMLAKDYCDDIYKGNKPTILLHRMLPKLLEDPDFQDKRDPRRTIFMLDEEDDVNEKINSAFCPLRIAVYNPRLEYIKSLVFPWFGKLEVVRKEGNNKIFSSMEDLIVGYESGGLDSIDVKLALQKAINDILELVGEFLRSNVEAQALITARKDQITADMQKILMQNEEFANLVSSMVLDVTEPPKLPGPRAPSSSLRTSGYCARVPHNVGGLPGFLGNSDFSEDLIAKTLHVL